MSILDGPHAAGERSDARTCNLDRDDAQIREHAKRRELTSDLGTERDAGHEHQRSRQPAVYLRREHGLGLARACRQYHGRRLDPGPAREMRCDGMQGSNLRRPQTGDTLGFILGAESKGAVPEGEHRLRRRGIASQLITIIPAEHYPLREMLGQFVPRAEHWQAGGNATRPFAANEHAVERRQKWSPKQVMPLNVARLDLGPDNRAGERALLNSVLADLHAAPGKGRKLDLTVPEGDQGHRRFSRSAQPLAKEASEGQRFGVPHDRQPRTKSGDFDGATIVDPVLLRGRYGYLCFVQVAPVPIAPALIETKPKGVRRPPNRDFVAAMAHDSGLDAEPEISVAVADNAQQRLAGITDINGLPPRFHVHLIAEQMRPEDSKNQPGTEGCRPRASNRGVFRRMMPAQWGECGPTPTVQVVAISTMKIGLNALVVLVRSAMPTTWRHGPE